MKNHSVADFNLREETIHNYIHYCTIFGMTHFSRKPRWVLQYLQSSPEDAVNAPETLSPPQHMTLQRKSPALQRHSPPPDEDSLRPTNSRQRPEPARVLSRPTRSAPSPPPDGARKEKMVAMRDISAAVSPPSPTPKSPPTSPLVDGFVGLQVSYCAMYLCSFARACVREPICSNTSCANTVCVCNHTQKRAAKVLQRQGSAACRCHQRPHGPQQSSSRGAGLLKPACASRR